MMKHYSTFSGLKELSRSGIGNLRYGSFLHPNPRFYKYQWRIFWRGSAVEGPAFMETPPLAIRAARALLVELNDSREAHVIYVTRRFRKGVSLWNLEHPKFRDVEFAPAYGDDPDPITPDGYR